MRTNLSFDIARTAVVALDCQAGIVSIYAKPEAEFLERASRVLSAARAAGMPVIFVQVAFRPGLPEVSSRNKLFAAVKSSSQHPKLFEGTSGAIHPALAPEGSDIVVTKHRISAFASTELEMLLRAQEIETVVLFGIATSGVVLSTVLHASDADYRIVVIADCCADLDAELHASLVHRLFPHRAEVVMARDFAEALQTC